MDLVKKLYEQAGFWAREQTVHEVLTEAAREIERLQAIVNNTPANVDARCLRQLTECAECGSHNTRRRKTYPVREEAIAKAIGEAAEVTDQC